MVGLLRGASRKLLMVRPYTGMIVRLRAGKLHEQLIIKIRAPSYSQKDFCGLLCTCNKIRISASASVAFELRFGILESTELWRGVAGIESGYVLKRIAAADIFLSAFVDITG